MRKLIISIALALLLVLIPASGVLAETSQDVTVTATPAFISIVNAPDNWTVNDEALAGGKTILTSITYYSNPLGDTTVPSDPVVDGECHFTITNSSSVVTDLTVNFADFTGGDAMVNSNDGSGGVGTFGSYSYCTGMTYSTGKVIAQATGSGPMKEDLGATTNIMWGLSCSTQTDAWESGTAMTATVTITATAS